MREFTHTKGEAAWEKRHVRRYGGFICPTVRPCEGSSHMLRWSGCQSREHNITAACWSRDASISCFSFLKLLFIRNWKSCIYIWNNSLKQLKGEEHEIIFFMWFRCKINIFVNRGMHLSKVEGPKIYPPVHYIHVTYTDWRSLFNRVHIKVSLMVSLTCL